MKRGLLTLILLVVTFSCIAYGPYSATVKRVIDGDTIEVIVDVWPNIQSTVKIRLADIDTPELNSPHKCERIKAQQAAQYVKKLLPVGSTINISNIKAGNFSNRYIGNIYINNGSDDLSSILLKVGYARKYHQRKQYKILFC